MVHAHLIIHLGLSLITLKLVGDGDVKIAVVSCVGSTCQRADNFVTSADCHGVRGIEDSLSDGELGRRIECVLFLYLLPMGVLGMGPGGKLNLFVCAVEDDVEPGQEGVNVVISSALEGE